MGKIHLSLAALVLPVLSFGAIGAEMEEVVVTGSYIKSSPTDGASPVDVVDRDYLDEMVPVSVSDITGHLTVNSGSENVPDSFTSGATQGTSNVNLRGLGLGSTLVLVNGRRNTLAAATANDGSTFVDTSMIPASALQRVEVLKEGAASIYGSDAVAGVVNYITQKDFVGVEFGAHYQTTSDSQDDRQLTFLYGWENDTTNVVVAAEFLDRAPLSSSKRPELTDQAISGLGNSFVLLGHLVGQPTVTVDSGPYAGTWNAVGGSVPDANCVANQGIIIPQSNGTERCGFVYGPRFNVVNDEERKHFYGNVQHDMGNGIRLNAELMWANVEVFDNPQSPSYPALSYLTIPIAPGQAGNPFGVPLIWVGRPLGSAFPSPNAPRDNDHLRFSLELDGELGDYHFNTALTRSTYGGYGVQPDTSTSRFSAAINGVGGPAGNQSWNLFTPTANSPELIDFISDAQTTKTDTDLTTFDFVVDGQMGETNFAAGLQYRRDELKIRRNDVSRVEFDAAGNLTKPADLLFLGGGVNVDASRNAWAAFAEFEWDVTEDLEFRLAGRYEDLASDSTFDPKLSMRFKVNDTLILRASASSSFREPALHQQFASVVGLQGIQDYNAAGSAVGAAVFIRIAQNANQNLKPEEADNLNLGFIWDPVDSFRLTVDYWAVDYTNVITIESAQGKVLANPNQSDVKRNSNGDLIGVTTNYFNAASVETDGFDIGANYLLPETDLGEMSVRFAATRMLKYEIPIGGRTTDVVGLFNHDNFARSLPETKANGTFRWARGNQNASLTARYISSYRTTKAAPVAGYSQNIDSFLTWDFQYNHEFSISDATARISLGILNLTDEAPPQVWDPPNFSYDPRQHDARGRMPYVTFKPGL
ncbi:MAG: TonB-dependent receptor [Proteobacteria bacterium]|nr:TonB-dependent receptor [Pseudomonadota bacterium]